MLNSEGNGPLLGTKRKKSRGDAKAVGKTEGRSTAAAALTVSDVHRKDRLRVDDVLAVSCRVAALAEVFGRAEVPLVDSWSASA